MNIKTTMNCIVEMVKQYDNIKDQEEYRDKCIKLVYNTLSIKDIYDAEILFDLALYGEGTYLTDTDDEKEYNLEIQGNDIIAMGKRLCNLEIKTEYRTDINYLFELLDFLNKKG